MASSVPTQSVFTCTAMPRSRAQAMSSSPCFADMLVSMSGVSGSGTWNTATMCGRRARTRSV